MGVPVTLLMLIFGLGGFILWLWALIDCLNNEPSEGNDKLIWVIVILFAQFFGALIYLIIRRPRRIEQSGR